MTHQTRRRTARSPAARSAATTRERPNCPPWSGAPPTAAQFHIKPLATLMPMEIGTLRVKTGLAEMLKGGVIMDVVDAEQARVAEEAGAVAVMARERVPADI